MQRIKTDYHIYNIVKRFIVLKISKELKRIQVKIRLSSMSVDMKYQAAGSSAAYAKHSRAPRAPYAERHRRVRVSRSTCLFALMTVFGNRVLCVALANRIGDAGFFGIFV